MTTCAERTEFCVTQAYDALADAAFIYGLAVTSLCQH